MWLDQRGEKHVSIPEIVVAEAAGEWGRGKVVAHDYFRGGMERPAPYQVELTDGEYSGELIFAPFDHDKCVRLPV